VTTRGATFIARERGNGISTPQRRFADEVPSHARWAEAFAILTAGLASVTKLGAPEASTLATAALNRAAEAVPAVMRDPVVRAVVAIGASLGERSVVPRPAISPPLPPPPLSSAPEPLPAPPAPASIFRYGRRSVTRLISRSGSLSLKQSGRPLSGGGTGRMRVPRRRS
jgi:hypothetical protein